MEAPEKNPSKKEEVTISKEDLQALLLLWLHTVNVANFPDQFECLWERLKQYCPNRSRLL